MPRAAELYRDASLGQALSDTLDELVQQNQITQGLSDKVCVCARTHRVACAGPGWSLRRRP